MVDTRTDPYEVFPDEAQEFSPAEAKTDLDNHKPAGSCQAIDADGASLEGLSATELSAIHQGPSLSPCGPIAVEGAVVREARRKRQFPPLEQGQFPKHLVVARPAGLELQEARKKVVSGRPTRQ